MMISFLNRLLPAWVGLFAFAGPSGATALSLDELLARPAALHGVVFEIVDRDPRALEVALPWVKQAAQRLKQRHPAIHIALVTHGQEMFALQTGARDSNPAVHQMAESLVRDSGVQVHACETYAGRRGLAPEDFPSFIDVTPTGPTQIRNYEALDYVLLVVPKAAVLKTH